MQDCPFEGSRNSKIANRIGPRLEYVHWSATQLRFGDPNLLAICPYCELTHMRRFSFAVQFSFPRNALLLGPDVGPM